MFVGMGLSAVFPVIDGLCMFGFEQMRRQMGFSWVVLQGALYILGAGLYAVSSQSISFSGIRKLTQGKMRWPERQYPGKVDVFGTSHQIFHLLVVLAAMSHLVGLLKAFHYRHGPYGAVCP